MAKNHKANQPLNPKTMAKPELLQSLSSLSSLQTQDVVKLSTSLNLEPPPHYFILLRTPRHKAFHCTVATPTVRCLLRRDTPLPTSGSWRFIRQNLAVSGETWLWFLTFIVTRSTIRACMLKSFSLSPKSDEMPPWVSEIPTKLDFLGHLGALILVYFLFPLFPSFNSYIICLIWWEILENDVLTALFVQQGSKLGPVLQLILVSWAIL